MKPLFSIFLFGSLHTRSLLNFKNEDNRSDGMGDKPDDREEVKEGSDDSKHTSENGLVIRSGNEEYSQVPQGNETEKIRDGFTGEISENRYGQEKLD